MITGRPRSSKLLPVPPERTDIFVEEEADEERRKMKTKKTKRG